ncbi:carbamoyltransferase HypF [Rugosimonospora africana]|uniref:carbamoyltransferase HypF n=1 Tax=Rugosimonospora africana TaxID=556532 RepID=UPI0019444FD2|nr:carbamoyltransferase HypF [Rugosimonospora africana]
MEIGGAEIGGVGSTVRLRVRVEGIVQGVGFRPFVHTLATKLRLAGHVGNDVSGVFIEVEGPVETVEEFLAALRRLAPPLSVVDRVATEPMPPTDTRGFAIVASDRAGTAATLISADSATCADCLRELDDPADRRYRYPFINCTNCGPRFTIVRGVPYDRPLTTMAGFPMCPACTAEYHDPADRRFHAQPTCCPDCGPALVLRDAAGSPLPGDPIAGAAGALRAGRILAVKGLGGYHLACSATDPEAAGRLRSRKHREDKPFAVMVPDLATARRLCEVDPVSEALLVSRAGPIVLMDRRGNGGVAGPVAPGNRALGVLLPYTPLHHLLLRHAAGPIVLTSGNVSDEPIAYGDTDAATRLAPIADTFLTHDRPVHVRTDDSVVRAFRDRPMLLRRSRGYAPEPVRLAWDTPRPVLACGAELKNTFCLARGRHAVVSQHIGDLENYPTLRSYAEGIEHFRRLFDVTPAVIAYDPHPEYLSTKYALEHEVTDRVAVQHHHAHIASCLADNGHPGPVIGVAFDGTGYGTDGTIWGGELLIADLAGFTRAGHFAPVPLPGGAAAIRHPWRMAVAYLDSAFAGAPPDGLDLLRRHDGSWRQVAALGRGGLNSPPTSSAGRLFDAVAALIGVRDTANYEGQAAIELEQRTDRAEDGAYRAGIEPGEPLLIAGVDLIRAAAADLTAGVAPGIIAARFHNGMVDAIVRACAVLRDASGLATVALSGGVFQNLLLLDRAVSRLSAAGFEVLTHSRVPPNDGGISLGQAAVAAALDRASRRTAPSDRAPTTSPPGMPDHAQVIQPAAT